MALPGSLILGKHRPRSVEAAIGRRRGCHVVLGCVVLIARNERVEIAGSNFLQRDRRRRSLRRAWGRLGIGIFVVAARSAILSICRVHVPRWCRAWSHKANALPAAKILRLLSSRATMTGSTQRRQPATGRRLRGQREGRCFGHGPVLGSRVGLLGSDVGIALCQRRIEMLEHYAAVGRRGRLAAPELRLGREAASPQHRIGRSSEAVFCVTVRWHRDSVLVTVRGRKPNRR